MMVKSRLLLAMVIFMGLLSGLSGQQDSPVFPQTRHRFAQMGLGLYYSHSPGIDMPLSQPLGSETSFRFAPQSQAALSISGLHFWGKVDFWINIPVWTHLHQSEPDYRFSRGVETGMKYFFLGNPYQRSVSPFLGVSFNNIGFQYLGDNQGPEDRGAELNSVRYPLHFGFAKVLNNRHYLELSASYFYHNEIDYFFNREDRRRLGMPPWHLNLGYRYIFDTTLSAEKDFQSGRTEEVTRRLAKDGGLNAFSFAVGMSSAFYLKNNAFNAEVSPFLGQPKGVNAYLELGLGYYFHQADAHLNVAYRNINSRATAYGKEQWMSRTALSLDMYKFLWDYHGFVPFVGISPSLERLQVDVRDGQTDFLVDQSVQQWRLGLVFGWDIRPNRLQSFILRTNLRYFPNLNIDHGGYRFHFDQLEVNFIQAVFYLNRIF